MFSARTQWDLTPDPLAKLLAEWHRDGRGVLDLTASNPTTCGITPDVDLMYAALAGAAAAPYQPDPLGQLSARQSVAAYYREAHGIPVDPSAILLAASTSELYSYCFRLLCDRGDEVVLAQPSYPLFDLLATIEDIRLAPFSLAYESGWHLDRRGVEASLTPRTRAIAVIHPNNPSGHYTSRADRQWLCELCAERSLALIVDEVFLDYPLPEADVGDSASFLATPSPCLTFVLSGLSKVCALPGMKLAWMAVAGPEELRAAALGRLEVIADTFLSPGTPVQQALPELLSTRHDVQKQIHVRLRQNLAALDSLCAGSPVQRLRCEGGWYAVLRVPATMPGHEAAMRLLQEHGVYLHPGSFFGLPEAGYLVVSLLTPAAQFSQGCGWIVKFCRSL